MLDLPAILKQAEAASDGPWTAELDYVSAFIPGKRPNGEIIGRWQTSISGLLSNEQRQANAEFAADARTDVPMLVAALEEAQGRYADGTGTCYCDTVGETPCAYCQIITLERQLAEAQEKLNAVGKEIHTVTHLDKKVCGHAVCGLARRVARILKEGNDG